MAYDRVPPVGACVSPDGHSCIEVTTYASLIPESAMCPRCLKPWTIVTFEVDA